MVAIASKKERGNEIVPPSRNGLGIRGLGLFAYLYLTRLKMAIAKSLLINRSKVFIKLNTPWFYCAELLIYF
jgi:hypothetical protein